MRILLACEKKFDSARPNDFYILYEQFLLRKKIHGNEDKFKKTVHRCWRKGITLENPKNESSPKNLPIPRTEVVFINWKIT